jgi:hypothetical protein
MGETAGKLRLVFDAIKRTRGVYLFDEFDPIAGKRAAARKYRGDVLSSVRSTYNYDVNQ